MEFTKTIDLEIDDNINPFNSCKVIIDSNKGRCFESNKQFKVGDLVFEENAFVYGKYDENINFTDECNYNLINTAFNTHISNKVSKKLNDDYNNALFEFSELETVQSMDTARCFMQLIAITKLRKSNKIDIIESTLCNIAENTINVLSISQKLQLFDLLGGANVLKCIEDIKLFRNLFPAIIDSSITNEEAGHILSVLNTNQIELEEFQGSGLFLGTAILEHNCRPNCSYSTCDDHLYLTAIKSINEGDRLSIDYLNAYYSNNYDRQCNLKKTYNFQCNCNECIGVDIKRSFKCLDCNKNVADRNSMTGIFHPIGIAGLKNKDTVLSTDWTCCNKCNKKQTLEYIKECLKIEEKYSSESLNTMKEIMNVNKINILNSNHYILFESWERISMNLTDEAKKINIVTEIDKKQKAMRFKLALEAMKKVVIMIKEVLPPVHHEKVVFFDRLGQLALASGDLELSKKCFLEAYEMNLLAVGDISISSTKKLYNLIENPPNSMDELILHYKIK